MTNVVSELTCMNPIEMIEKIEAQLLSTPAGVTQIVVDGQTVSFDRAEAIRELDRWKRLAAKQSGKRKLFRGVDLSYVW